MQENNRERIVASAVWAAYGDALGFQTELADASIVAQRIGSDRATDMKPWRRLIGGKFGTFVDLPAGTYSDDTQLRLGVCRAIRSDGAFDVEAFAKVELPVWLGYALGGGRGTKAAATALASRNVNWFSNFFDSPGAVYMRGGGNGAAMRVQPHVWCARDLRNERSFMVDVVRNAVSTHGHLRAIAGAMVHASILAYVLRERDLPPPSVWMDFAEVIQGLPEVIAEDVNLQTIWLPTWEKREHRSLMAAAMDAADEWAHAVGLAVSLLDGEPRSAYRSVVESLKGLSSDERGSGLKASLFSLCAVWAMRDLGPKRTLEEVANLLHSDTDTIASMAGALIGALSGSAPQTDAIQDLRYIESEALRMHAISCKAEVESFHYPDLLYWAAPKSALDIVGKFEDGLAVAGLGKARSQGDPKPGNPKGSSWQWLSLEFGQSILCKRRDALKALPKEVLPAPAAPAAPLKSGPKQVRTPDLFSEKPLREQSRPVQIPPIAPEEERLSLDRMTDLAIRSGFDARIIGEHLVKLAVEENGLELAVAYAAIVAKAKRVRQNR